ALLETAATEGLAATLVSQGQAVPVDKAAFSPVRGATVTTEASVLPGLVATAAMVRTGPPELGVAH
ncbi:hypothetical protein ACT18_25410, partial [Mycolicibacter kumamotonensis]